MSNRLDKKQSLLKLLHNKFIGNTGWLMFQNIYSMLLSLIIGALSARYLGPDNYGLIGYGASLVSFCCEISQLGLNSILMNELLTRPQKKGQIMGTALLLRLAASLVGFCCILILASIIEPGNRIFLIVTGLQAFAIICRIYELLNQWFLSELNSRVYVVAASIGATVVGIWKVTLLILQASVEWFAASTTVQALVCGGIVFAVFFRQKQFRLDYSLEEAKLLFGKGKHYIVSGIAVALYTQMDQVMLGKMMGEWEVGIYRSAITIAMLWEFIPQAIINSAMAVILEKKTKSYSDYMKLLRFLFLGISVMSLLVAIVMQFGARFLVFMLYGREYMDAVPLLQLLIWSTGFAMIGTARNIWTIAEDKNRFVKYFTIVGSCFNLVFNYLTIPVWGMYGAALGTFFSQIVVSLISPLFWKETRPFVRLYFESWKIRSTLKGMLKR